MTLACRLVALRQQGLAPLKRGGGEAGGDWPAGTASTWNLR